MCDLHEIELYAALYANNITQWDCTTKKARALGECISLPRDVQFISECYIFSKAKRFNKWGNPEVFLHPNSNQYQIIMGSKLDLGPHLILENSQESNNSNVHCRVIKHFGMF